MRDEIATFDPTEFVAFAADRYEIWSSVKGQRITHRIYGRGTFCEPEVTTRGLTIRIRFDSPHIDGVHIRRYLITDLANGRFGDLTLPQDIVHAILADRSAREHHEHMRLQEEHRRKEQLIREQHRHKEQLIRINLQRRVNEILGGCVDLQRVPQTEWKPEEIYATLTDDDICLARLWMPVEVGAEHTEYHEAKMVSARAAEKAAARFYQSIGHLVDDVSLSQLRSENDDWRTHDLLLDKSVPIDVKNSRTPVNNRNRYFDHTVQKFKESREGRHVIVAGMLSPYLKLEHIWRSEDIAFDIPPVRFLGQVTRSEIDELIGIFSKPHLDISHQPSTAIPPWMYDFPPRFYKTRAEGIARLRDLDLLDLPEQAALEINPVPSCLSAAIPLPERWSGFLPKKWQRDLYERLLERRNLLGSQMLTLPVLFLSILSHFVEMAVGILPCDDYSPADYADLLYTRKGLPKFPIGIYDPLNIIEELCMTLNDLWENRSSIALTEFGSYKFHALGILQGLSKADQRWITIVAYCGGRVKEKGKCGKSPLILGREQACGKCGKLICPKCGFCSMNCSQYMARVGGSRARNVPVRILEDNDAARNEDEIPF